MATSTRAGRTARTKGVSMQPDELQDATVIEELTGLGFSEVYRRHFAPRMRAAAQVLRQATEAGVELDRAQLVDVWTIHMTVEELSAIYAQESTLARGD